MHANLMWNHAQQGCLKQYEEITLKEVNFQFKICKKLLFCGSDKLLA